MATSVFLEGYFKVLRWIGFLVLFLLLIYNLWNWVQWRHPVRFLLWETCWSFLWSLIVTNFCEGFVCLKLMRIFCLLGMHFSFQLFLLIILLKSSRSSLFGDLLLSFRRGALKHLLWGRLTTSCLSISFLMKYFKISCQEHHGCWLLYKIYFCIRYIFLRPLWCFVFEFYCLEVILFQCLFVSIFLLCCSLFNLFFVSFLHHFVSGVSPNPRISAFIEEFNLDFLLMCLNSFLQCWSMFCL